MRAKDLIIKESDLFEIDMSPSNLQRLAGVIDARAGMEFEMVVPDVAGGDDSEPDPIRDDEADIRARNFEQIFDFFYDGEYNSRREVNRLIEELKSDFDDWLKDETKELWREAAPDYLLEYVKDNYADSLKTNALDEFKQEYDREPNEESKVDQAHLESLISQGTEEMAQDILKAGADNRDYESAMEEWIDLNVDEKEYQEQWLKEEGLNYMSDIADRERIQWPYWLEPVADEGRDIETVGQEFSSAIGKEVIAGGTYHGAKRSSSAYSLEPDSSIRPESPGDVGLEFISPPMPLSELISDLENVIKWARRNGCYTNSSTGLHMNISVPGWSGKLDDLDYVKLALLLGDQYVLDQFDRSSNTYAKSALETVKKYAEQRPDDVAVLLKQMKQHLSVGAAKIVHSGVTNKHTSINVKNGYIEFRSPGGDWLLEDLKTLINTLLRFVVAMDAAVDPNKYRQEYLKKLYAILQPKSNNDTVAYFARYAAGQLPKQALKSFIKQAQLERQAAKGAGIAAPAAEPLSQTDIENRMGIGSQSADANYEIVNRQTRRPVFLFIANTNQDAQRKFADWVAASGLDGNDYIWQARRPAQQNAGTLAGWRIMIGDQEVHRFGGIGNNQDDANNFARRWLESQPSNRTRQFPPGRIQVLPIMHIF